MALTASTILADAEALAYPYVSERALAPGPLLRTLTTLDAEVTGLLASSASGLKATDATPISILLASNAAGYSLQAAKSYKDFKYIDSDGVAWPVRVVPFNQRDNPPFHPSVWVQNGKVYPCDPSSKRWTDTSGYTLFWKDGGTLTYSYIANDKRLTALADTLLSPDYAAQYFSWSLAYQILLSFHGIEGIVPPEKLDSTGQAIGAIRKRLLQAIASEAKAEASARARY